MDVALRSLIAGALSGALFVSAAPAAEHPSCWLPDEVLERLDEIQTSPCRPDQPCWSEQTAELRDLLERHPGSVSDHRQYQDRAQRDDHAGVLAEYEALMVTQLDDGAERDDELAKRRYETFRAGCPRDHRSALIYAGRFGAPEWRSGQLDEIEASVAGESAQARLAALPLLWQARFRLTPPPEREDLQVITVNIDQIPGLVQPFVTEHELSMPVLFGAELVQEWWSGAISIPRTWVVDREGVVRYRQMGFSAAGKDTWVAEARERMESAAGPDPASR